MSNPTYRIKPSTLQDDTDALAALKNIPDYRLRVSSYALVTNMFSFGKEDGVIEFLSTGNFGEAPPRIAIRLSLWVFIVIQFGGGDEIVIGNFKQVKECEFVSISRNTIPQQSSNRRARSFFFYAIK
jgi:hypothetical protein